MNDQKQHIITSHSCNYVLHLCLCSAFLTPPMYVHMRYWDWECLNRHVEPLMLVMFLPILIYITERCGNAEIDTNSFLSSRRGWCLCFLLPDCSVMLSYVFKKNLSWAIPPLCYASCTSQGQTELHILKNRFVGNSFFPHQSFLIRASLFRGLQRLRSHLYSNFSLSSIIGAWLCPSLISRQTSEGLLTASVGSLTFWKCASFYHL